TSHGSPRGALRQRRVRNAIEVLPAKLGNGGVGVSGSPGIQLLGTLQILRHTPSVFVHHTQIELCIPIVFLGGQAEPVSRLRIVLSALADTLTEAIQISHGKRGFSGNIS